MEKMKDDFMVFSGTANLPLAEAVATQLGKPLNKIDIKHFPDGETFCQVVEGVRGRDVFVIQSGSPAPNEAYMELFIIIDAQDFAMPIGRKYFINVGSVGQPRDGDPRAAYLLYDPMARKIRFRRVDYDIAAAQAKVREAGLPERLAVRLAYGQ